MPNFDERKKIHGIFSTESAESLTVQSQTDRTASVMRSQRKKIIKQVKNGKSNTQAKYKAIGTRRFTRFQQLVNVEFEIPFCLNS